jgi:hypothetical protein
MTRSGNGHPHSARQLRQRPLGETAFAYEPADRAEVMIIGEIACTPAPAHISVFR